MNESILSPRIIAHPPPISRQSNNEECLVYRYRQRGSLLYAVSRLFRHAPPASGSQTDSIVPSGVSMYQPWIIEPMQRRLPSINCLEFKLTMDLSRHH